MRSFGAPFTFAGFFFFPVSPFRPSGAAWIASLAFSSALAGAGVSRAFSFAFVVFTAAFSAAMVLAFAL
jgi:hypothetical protein